MKRILFLLVACTMGISVFSQSMDDIDALYNKKDYKGAKAGIDAYLAETKNAAKPEAWYYKGRIYNALSYEKTTPESEKMPLKLAAFDAFKKNQQLDPKDIRMGVEFFKSYLDLYFGLYDLGATFFNEKNYSAAYQAFVNAQLVEDYILAKKYTYPEAKLYKLDTALVLNTAVAATQSKDDAAAIKYYQKLADANVSGETYMEVYEYLANYYAENNNAAQLDALLAKARNYYPANGFWNDAEIKIVSKNGDKNAVYAKYEQMIDKTPADFNLGYNYSVELYNDLYGKDAKPATDAARTKLTQVLKKVIPNDKGVDALLLMSNHLFNVSADYASEASMIKSTKPDDIKRKKDINALSLKVMDEYIPYAMQAVKWFEEQPTLKPMQKANFRGLLGNLSDVYTAKGDPKKAAEFQKKASLAN